MPARIRLTLWYTILLGATLIAASTLLFWVLKFSLHNQVDTNLQDRAQQIAARIKDQATLDLRTGTVFIPEANDFSSTATYIQVLRTDGTVVDASSNLGGARFPINQTKFAENLQRQFNFQTMEIDDTTLRIYSTPL
ncbi:MAG: sensor histidine kinase N-terminal domain-containing protein, partial [Anaerolineae bacterium]|nr:sensor histidine kinase N-terminal domain-containing protein [Anaerolineae bacterium]